MKPGQLCILVRDGQPNDVRPEFVGSLVTFVRYLTSDSLRDLGFKQFFNLDVAVSFVHPPDGIVMDNDEYCRRTHLAPIGNEPESNLVDETIELPITFPEGVEA